MIQRIQSVYLFLAFAACCLVFFLPFADFTLDAEKGYYYFTVLGLYTPGPDKIQVFNWLFALPLWLMNSLTAVLCLYILFQYKNRIQQLKLLRITVFINILFVGLIFYYASSLIEKKLGMTSHYKTGIIMPLISLVMEVLATQSIRKDERMVRSADRLR